MKMAKASEADIQMALMLTTQLETLDRGYFPMAQDADDFVDGQFDCDSPSDCQKAMELLLDTMQRGSLFRVVFGMSVLLDPKNEAIDHSCDYLEHHPKARMHSELIAMLTRIADDEEEHVGARRGWYGDLRELLAKAGPTQ